MICTCTLSYNSCEVIYLLIINNCRYFTLYEPQKTHILLNTINETLQVYIVSVLYDCIFYFFRNKAFNLKINIKLLSVPLISYADLHLPQTESMIQWNLEKSLARKNQSEWLINLKTTLPYNNLM